MPLDAALPYKEGVGLGDRLIALSAAKSRASLGTRITETLRALAPRWEPYAPTWWTPIAEALQIERNEACGKLAPYVHAPRLVAAVELGAAVGVPDADPAGAASRLRCVELYLFYTTSIMALCSSVGLTFVRMFSIGTRTGRRAS